jgi:putative SOS response-associated peptidase YedK
MKPIHDRMPVILAPQDWGAWLDAPVDKIMAMVTPFDGGLIQAWPVSSRVNKTVDDDLDLIRPAN